MAIPHANPNEVIDVRPLGTRLGETITHTLFKTEQLEVIRLVIPAGKEIPSHQVDGPITVQCLEGRLEFEACGKRQTLSAGEMLFLSGGELHSLKGVEDASAVVTIVLVKK